MYVGIPVPGPGGVVWKFELSIQCAKNTLGRAVLLMEMHCRDCR